MKVAKVMAMMKRGKHIMILRRDYPKAAVEEIEPDSGTGAQWISDGRATYCLAGTPLIQSAGQFYATYDVNAKQQSEFYFRFQSLPVHLDSGTSRQWETSPVDASPLPVTVGIHGDVFKPFQYGGRILFANEFYLAPFDDEHRMMLRYEVRRDDLGIQYLRVIDGLMLDTAAAIYPVRFASTEQSTELYDTLSDCVAEISRQQREYAEQHGDGEEQE